MDNLQNVLSDITGLAVTIFVSTIVWTILIAGLYQLIRDEIRQVLIAPRRLRGLAQEGYSQ